MTQRKKFALPVVDQSLTTHFGHCEKFAIVETENGSVTSIAYLTPPMHQPGVYPGFLAQQGVDVIISGGMGMKAQNLFAMNNIEVCVGIPNGSPQELVEQYLEGKLSTGRNLCDH
jgi:predicted Fe-Mo cluster-binding NifX family protein